MKTQNNLRCPICEKTFDRAATNSMPFCSPRCRQVDLGRWLTESYSLPCEGDDHPEGFDLDNDL